MSEILKEFAKIAREQNLISFGEEKENKKKEWTSAEMLYGIKIDKKEKNILEEAHPESPVVLPAYNPINGLVENLQQRHDVMVDIATRKPKVNFNQNFYVEAYQNLLNETIKTGFYLDQINQEKLANLSDQCANSLHKRAGWPLILGIVAGVASLYGVLYTSNNPDAQGIKQDTQKALDKLKEIEEDNPNVLKNLMPLRMALEKLLHYSKSFYKYNDEILNMFLRISGVDSDDEKRKAIAANVKELLEGPKHEEILKSFKEFKRICEEVVRLIPYSQEYLKRNLEHSQEAENSTFFKLKKLFREYVLNTDESDLIALLNNLKIDIAKVPANIEEQIEKMNELKQKSGLVAKEFPIQVQ